MNLRFALHELACRHGLDRVAARRLFALAGFDRQPDSLNTWLWRVAAVLGAALGGLGVILWIAANWETMERLQRFMLLQGFVLATCAGAAWHRAARVPLSVLALLGIGALLAFFGQTYQTGADPWQLFALWTLLGLPLALGTRSDSVWAPWAVVATVGIALWSQAHASRSWWVQAQDLRIHGMALAAALLVTAGMAPALRRWTGAGLWALRTAGTLALTFTTLLALAGLFGKAVAPQYALGLALLAASAALTGWGRHFDIFLLSGATLGLNVLLVSGLVRWLIDDDNIAGMLLIIGLSAAALLAVSVNLILRLARRARGGEA